MRIISGIYKNRRINFKNLQIRPTTDFAKESLFNLLDNYYDLKELSVLDLFAGSGNISYEFVSRGCKKIFAIEHNMNCVKFMQKTQDRLKMTNLHIQRINAYQYLKKTKMKYDIIFADPPYTYKQAEYDKIIDLVFNKNTISPAGKLIIEHSKNITFQNNSFFHEHRRYGKVNFTFLKYE